MRWILPLLLVLVAWTPVRAQEAVSVHFRFAPTDGEVWLQEVHTETLQDDGGTDVPTRWASDETYRLDYQEQSDGGWLVRRTLVEGKLEMQGESGPTPVQEISRGYPLRYHLDAAGRLQEVEGYRVLMRKLERGLPPEVWQRFRASVSLESARQGDRRRWNRVLAGLVGRTVEVGEVWAVRDLREAGSGPVQVFGTLRFDGWTTMEGRRVFKLVFDFVDDPSRRVAPEQGFDGELDLLGEEAAEVPRLDLGLDGKVIRVVDPETGHLIYERQEYAFSRAVGGPGTPVARYETLTLYRGRPAGSPQD